MLDGHRTVECIHCGSESLIRNSLTRIGKQGYKSKSCGRQKRTGSSQVELAGLHRWIHSVLC